MIKLEDLWIGDELKITSSGRVGTYEGKHANGNAIIRSDNKTYLADVKDLEIYTAPKEIKEIVFEQAPKLKTPAIGDSIDLHIEKLNPHMIGSRPERILDIQIKAFEDFFEAAKQSYKSEITVIHGKGTGVLKNAVMSIIKTDKSIQQCHAIHNGGAVRLVL